MKMHSNSSLNANLSNCATELEFIGFALKSISDERYKKILYHLHEEHCTQCLIRTNHWEIAVKLSYTPNSSSVSNDSSTGTLANNYSTIDSSTRKPPNNNINSITTTKPDNGSQTHANSSDYGRLIDYIKQLETRCNALEAQLLDLRSGQCNQWKDADFLKFWMNKLDDVETKLFNDHVRYCFECREHFSLLMKANLLQHRSLLNKQILYNQFVGKQTLHNNDKQIDSSVVTIIKETSPIPFKPERNRFSVFNPTDIVRSNFMKMAAMFLLALSPVIATYYFLTSSYQDGNHYAISANQPPGSSYDAAFLLSPANIDQIEELVKNRNLDKAQELLEPVLLQAEVNPDLSIYSKLLYLEGRMFSAKSNYQAAIDRLDKAIEIAEKIGRVDLQLNPTITLSFIYQNSDDNVKAKEYANRAIEMALTEKSTKHQIISLRMLGISKFFLNESPDAEEYIKESFVLAKETNNNYEAAQALTFLGVIRTEQEQYTQANEYFDQAVSMAAIIKDHQMKVNLQAIVAGYQARACALAGNVTQAVDLYMLALEKAQQANVQQYLALSQFHQGLAECFDKQRKQELAASERAKAVEFEQQAYAQCEISNTMLSFAITRKSTNRCLKEFNSFQKQ